MGITPSERDFEGARLLLGGRDGAAGAAGAALWTLGWFVWLAGGIVSFGHAFG